MKCSALFSLIVPLVLAAACTQAGDQQGSLTEPTAVASAAAPSSSAAVDRSLKAARANASSTTCSAYQERLEAHQLTLERFPGDETATEAVATYASLIADACS